MSCNRSSLPAPVSPFRRRNEHLARFLSVVTISNYRTDSEPDEPVQR